MRYIYPNFTNRYLFRPTKILPSNSMPLDFNKSLSKKMIDLGVIEKRIGKSLKKFKEKFI